MALLVRLALREAVILEGLQFRAFGWNVPDQCNPGDFSI
jgi:hypothetical protein